MNETDHADCVFCGIVVGTAPRHEVIADTPGACAFMNANPAGFGHVLVIPKMHATDIWDLQDRDAEAVWDLVRQIAAAAKRAFDPDGLNLFQANGRAGWQSVFHFHIHVVPRWEGDALIPNWTVPLGDRATIPAAARRLREGLQIV